MPEKWKSWTRIEEHKLAALFKEGHKNSTIAKKLGRPVSSVAMKRLRLNLLNYSRKTYLRDREIERLALEGWYDKEIGEKLGMSKDAVGAVRKRLNITAGRFSAQHTDVALYEWRKKHGLRGAASVPQGQGQEEGAS